MNDFPKGVVPLLPNLIGLKSQMQKRGIEIGDMQLSAAFEAICLVMSKEADRIEELEERLKAATDDAKEAEDYAEELEAKLAKAVEALERIEDASKYFGNCPEASETTVRYAHETTRRLARTTLAELTGGKDE